MHYWFAHAREMGLHLVGSPHGNGIVAVLTAGTLAMLLVLKAFSRNVNHARIRWWRLLSAVIIFWLVLLLSLDAADLVIYPHINYRVSREVPMIAVSAITFMLITVPLAALLMKKSYWSTPLNLIAGLLAFIITAYAVNAIMASVHSGKKELEIVKRRAHSVDKVLP